MKAGALAALAAVLVLALLAVTARLAPSRSLAHFSVRPVAPGLEGDGRLAQSVRYSDEFALGRRTSIHVTVRGAHGGVLLSLVDADDSVREVALEPGEGRAAFGSARPGAYRLRAVARPMPTRPRQTAPSAPVEVLARSGGRPWGLLALAALLVLLPPLVVVWRRRGDARPDKR